MMTNRFLTALCSIIPMALAFCACDDISSDDRFIDMDTVMPERAVLIEDFTGQNCSNCPDAHAVINLLKEQYGDAVIAVSIHAGNFGVDVNNTSFSDNYIGLMEPEGNEYNDRWNIDSWPAGVVNRHGGAMEHDKWAAAVRSDLSSKAVVDIDVEAGVTEGKINISTTISPKADINGHLQLWITEDDIVAFQRNGSKRIPDYRHNHVFRAAVNGTWGEPVTLVDGVHKEMTHTIALRNSKTEVWNPSNLSVVAFIYDDSGVLQATKTKVINQNN